MLDTLSQAAIFFLGVTSILLIARKNKWGLVVGLSAQPFWFITTYMHQQWWLFLVSIVYTLSWLYGIFTWFGEKKTTNGKGQMSNVKMHEGDVRREM